jgi:hypothetical protein
MIVTMLLASHNRSFILQIIVINTNRTVITIVNYICKTFIVEARDLFEGTDRYNLNDTL